MTLELRAVQTDDEWAAMHDIRRRVLFAPRRRRMEAEVAGLRYADQTEPADKTAFIQKHVYLRMLYLLAGQRRAAY